MVDKQTKTQCAQHKNQLLNSIPFSPQGRSSIVQFRSTPFTCQYQCPISLNWLSIFASAEWHIILVLRLDHRQLETSKVLGFLGSRSRQVGEAGTPEGGRDS